MIIELKTKAHSDYVHDTVTFEDGYDWIEISYQGYDFSVRKSELKKVLTLLCEEDE